jgi:hypothetical protein
VVKEAIRVAHTYVPTFSKSYAGVIRISKVRDVFGCKFVSSSDVPNRGGQKVDQLASSLEFEQTYVVSECILAIHQFASILTGTFLLQHTIERYKTTHNWLLLFSASSLAASQQIHFRQELGEVKKLSTRVEVFLKGRQLVIIFEEDIS